MTVPVTAPGQSVVRIVDKSGNGQLLALTDVTYGVDSTGRPHLYFDGNTARGQITTFNLSSVSALTIAAAFETLNPPGTAAIVYEHSPNSSANAGCFALIVPTGANQGIARTRGASSAVDINLSGYAAPVKMVTVQRADLATPNSRLEINGQLFASNSAATGGGNFSSRTFYVGSRAGSSLHSEMRLYGLIVRGSSSLIKDMAYVARWLNMKCGAY